MRKSKIIIAALFCTGTILLNSCSENKEKSEQDKHLRMLQIKDSLKSDSLIKGKKPARTAAQLQPAPLPYVKIGNQVWESQNLDVSTFRNGDTIKEKENKDDFRQAGDYGQPAWCYYNGDKKNKKYGKFYNWYAIHDGRGLAPQGWHIPSNDEWMVLTNYLRSNKVAPNNNTYENFAGIKMKSKNEWDGDNSSGFNALSAGYLDYRFVGLGKITGFWSATDRDPG